MTQQNEDLLTALATLGCGVQNVEAGALVHTALYDAYWGDRTGVLMDGNGYLWSMASKIENVSQEEIARRARAWYQV